ncbi:MAG: response regulator transcription factor [Clostridiales Family XIII bacterium]|jgi:two-component system KDP operon response regulator KdpE|nr:response regulator transcription factor [Clostridiales Family XIII bacterium]
MSHKARILVVDDENSILRFLTTVLEANEYEVIAARTGKEAISMVTSRAPDLVLLDLGLPDEDGLAVLKRMRGWSAVPILVVSARMHEKDKVEALDAGADDYITKPFGSSELLARIRTAIRHSRERGFNQGASSTGRLVTGGLAIDLDKRKVLVDGETAHLTQNEYRILALLARNAGRVLTYDYLLKEVWGPAMVGDNQILRVNMANIRRKIEKNPADPEYITTEIGVGYRLRDPDA